MMMMFQRKQNDDLQKGRQRENCLPDRSFPFLSASLFNVILSVSVILSLSSFPVQFLLYIFIFFVFFLFFLPTAIFLSISLSISLLFPLLFLLLFTCLFRSLSSTYVLNPLIFLPSQMPTLKWPVTWF